MQCGADVYGKVKGWNWLKCLGMGLLNSSRNSLREAFVSASCRSKSCRVSSIFSSKHGMVVSGDAAEVQHISTT